VKSPFYFIIKPIGERYSNSVDVNGKSLIVNSEVFNHEYVNRQAIVVSTPLAYETEIKVGDTIIVHHNVFRRILDVKGREKNSRAFINEDTYMVDAEQIFAYKRHDDWKPVKGYTFVLPVKNDWKYSLNPEKPMVGIVAMKDEDFDKGDVIGFSPNDEYEFIIGGERVYRIMKKFITMKYEGKRNEEAYNPSWA
jgi:hypothetical protein|tara:strand:+ start:542 stop:1123 length:582 start_codon:yes stop_codon:yes gene_type:complete